MGDEESTDQPNERRRYFRISDTVLLQADPVPAELTPELAEQLTAPLPDAFYLASEFNVIKQETAILHRHLDSQSNSLRRYLDALDRKLDRVCEVLLVQAMGADAAPTVEVDIGAEGMGFGWPQAYAIGTVLDLRIVLLSSGSGVRLLSEVMRCDEDPTTGGYQIGVSFRYQRESDRELLVQHVLRRQASLLRSRHEQDD